MKLAVARFVVQLIVELAGIPTKRARLMLPRTQTCSLLLAALGCAGSDPGPMTEVEARAVRDTVIVLEEAMNSAVDRLDCGEGFAVIGDQEPMFVTNARVVRTHAAFREDCDRMVAARTGAVFTVDTLTAHALSADAAYVVREGLYTINLTDGTSRRVYLVMTTVWARHTGSWKMVHLHESLRAP